MEKETTKFEVEDRKRRRIHPGRVVLLILGLAIPIATATGATVYRERSKIVVYEKETLAMEAEVAKRKSDHFAAVAAETARIAEEEEIKRVTEERARQEVEAMAAREASLKQEEQLARAEAERRHAATTQAPQQDHQQYEGTTAPQQTQNSQVELEKCKTKLVYGPPAEVMETIIATANSESARIAAEVSLAPQQRGDIAEAYVSSQIQYYQYQQYQACLDKIR